MHHEQTEELKNNPHAERCLKYLDVAAANAAMAYGLLAIAQEVASLRKEVKSQSSGIKRTIKRS